MEEKNNNQVEKKFNGIALASFICAMVSLVTLPSGNYYATCAIAAIVTGIIGLVKFDKENEKGRWMAITGLSIGGAVFAIFIIALIFAFVAAGTLIGLSTMY